MDAAGGQQGEMVGDYFVPVDYASMDFSCEGCE